MTAARGVFPPPLPGQEMARRSPHELVRDFPEALAVFRAHGVDLAAGGARPVADLLEETSDEGLLRDLEQHIAWRGTAGR